MAGYKRKGTLINWDFYHFLLPTILSTVAISLNEFVDSIIVSRLLGSDAMGMVNMGFPIMLAFAVIYTLTGIGGSILYAQYAGMQESQKANRSFSAMCVFSVLVAVAVSVAGMAFLNPLAYLMCKDAKLLSQFEPYLGVLIFSGVLIIPLQVIIAYLPALGKPGTGTAINIVANAVNLLMDYVYIHFFMTGLKGAALATLTGYVTGLVILLGLCMAKKVSFPICRFGTDELKELPVAMGRGMAPALNQLGYCIKISFCNSIAMGIAGIDGVSIFTLCMQVVSIMSITIAGIVGAMMPIASALKGEGDTEGIRILLKTVMVTQLAVNIVQVVLLEVFPQFILLIYNVQGDLIKPATEGIRLFSIMFIFRGFVMVFMLYFQVISRMVYATVISLIDGFLGLIPLILILTPIMGLNGLWVSFSLLSFLLLVGILITNMVIAARSRGKYIGILLIENEEGLIQAYDATIPLTDSDISENARLVQTFCHECVDEALSGLVAVSSEEMGQYCLKHREGHHMNEMDMLIKIYPDDIVMDVRSIGKPFDIMSSQEEEYSNLDILRRIASSIKYTYVTGMNQTRIRFANKAASSAILT